MAREDLACNVAQSLSGQGWRWRRSGGDSLQPDALVDDAIRLFDEYLITVLFVVEEERPVGVLHIHDLTKIGR